MSLIPDALCMVSYRRVFVCFQSYTASVLEGSNPTFKWTVDDKPYFTYYNTVLNVIYQHAATYKLTVSFFLLPDVPSAPVHTGI